MLSRQTILFLIFILIGGSASRSAQTPAKKITPADLQKLRWIEGTWRGTGINQPAFFERYRFESDSVLVVDSFDDEKLTKVTETTRFELKDGELVAGVKALDTPRARSTTIQFCLCRSSKRATHLSGSARPKTHGRQ